MGRIGTAVAASVLLAAASVRAEQDPWARAVALVARMTQEEKMGMLQGAPKAKSQRDYIGTVTGVPRLDIPDLLLNDGPQGFRVGPAEYAGTTTQWPSGLTVAHSFDPSLFAEWGAAMGAEFAGKGANVQYGPGVNVARVANGGRSFEYLSGEDPFLGWTLVQPVVKGIQSAGIIANAKHYIDNDQEGLNGRGDRHSTNVNIDERTEMEIYFPPFGGAVEAGALSVMCANNLVNGQYVCQNNVSINTQLKAWAGFKGWVCSDYDGTRSTVTAANSGLDLAMPGPPSRPDYFGQWLADAVRSGAVPQSVIDDKATRLVYSLAAVGALDRPSKGNISSDVTSANHTALARKLATASATLLQNRDGLLPLSLRGVGTVALIGKHTGANGSEAIYGGGGSGAVVPKAPVSIYDALVARLGAGAVTATNPKDASDAAAAAKNADVAVVVLAQTSHEGADRTTLALDGDDVVAAVGEAQPNTVVVTISPGPFATNWSNSVAAIVDFGFPGEQEGEAVADILFGVANPTGKMPHTMPHHWNEVGMTPEQYPGIAPPKDAPNPCSFTPDPQPNPPKCTPTQVNYSEAMLVGYRWYDAKGVEPKFPFGHGLSYTTFAYSGIRATKTGPSEATVAFTVKNTGSVAGAEVAQVYVAFPDAAGEPPQQLKGFSRVVLDPGDSKAVTVALGPRSFSVWDTATHGWEPVPGAFGVRVGSSSRDIRLTATVNM